MPAIVSILIVTLLAPFLFLPQPTLAADCISGFYKLTAGEYAGMCKTNSAQSPVIYDPVKDPNGKCEYAMGQSINPACLTQNYSSAGGAPNVNSPSTYLDSRCIGRARPLECQLAVNANVLDSYSDDICFSQISLQDGTLTATGSNGAPNQLVYNTLDANGQPLYNSDTCKAKRGKAKCDQKQAQGFVYTYVLGSDPETSCYSFTSVVTVLMQYAMLIAAVICGFMFLWGGIKYTISKGNPAALMEARDQILHATIGLVVILMAYIIVLFLQGSLGFLGVNLVGPFGYLGGT